MRIAGRSFQFVLAIACVFAGWSTASAAPCETPEHRQFDFWVGDWEVRTSDDKLAGFNRIERDYGGCVLHERYTTQGEYRGESLNVYDPGRKVWHQTWVDTSGTLLLLEGGLRDGKMVLEGETKNAKGRRTKHRITWTPNEDGTVRQFWQMTDKDGKWMTAFDGLYRRK